MSKQRYFWFAIKSFLGFGNVEDASICWFSKRFFDVHDYPVSKGGDGIPSHFYKYQCWECGAKFDI